MHVFPFPYANSMLTRCLSSSCLVRMFGYLKLLDITRTLNTKAYGPRVLCICKDYGSTVMLMGFGMHRLVLLLSLLTR